MVENARLTLIQDVTQTLQAILPHLQFQFYAPTDNPDCLYVFGFSTSHQLVGGYTLFINGEPLQSSLQVPSCAQFFRNASTSPTPRFFPEDLQTCYQQYLLLREVQDCEHPLDCYT